jgi:hypothetical protein
MGFEYQKKIKIAKIYRKTPLKTLLREYILNKGAM